MLVLATACTTSDEFKDSDGSISDSTIDAVATTPDGPPQLDDSGQPLPKDSGTTPTEDLNIAPPDDAGLPPPKDSSVPQPDVGPPPPPPPPGDIKVAAIQFGPGQYTNVSGCANDNCAIKHFITKAYQQGAQYVLVPESAIELQQNAAGQSLIELTPQVGDAPASNLNWGSGSVIAEFCQLADTLNITLLFHLYTWEGVSDEYYSTLIAVGPDGKVLKTHYKYYLYAGEKQVLTAGTNCCDMFNTPAGEAGLLICADINCVPDMYIGGSNCTTNNYNKMMDFIAQKPYIAFIPTFWIGWKSFDWQAINVFKKFATLSGAYTVGANTIATFTPGCSGTCKGGGIFKPDGTAIDEYNSDVPGFAIGVIPKKGTTPPPPPPGKVVITEFMANPDVASDTVGEWFEVYNPGTTPVDLNGWTIKGSTDAHVISTSGGLMVQPDSYVVLGKETSTTTNGGVPVDYSYGSWNMSNTGDAIILFDASLNEIDRVEYSSSWSVAIPDGASLSLTNTSADNNQSSNWCKETSAWSGSAGDKGTPGQPAGCP